MTFGCHQKKASEGPNLSAKVVSQKKTASTNEKTKAAVNPAVIYRSEDLGATWSSFAKGIPAAATLSGIQQDGNKVYISTDYHGIFVISKDQDTWTPLNTEALKGLDINCIDVDADKLVIGTLRNGILLSNDGGQSWKPSEQNIQHSPIRAFIKSANKLYAGTDAGIFESADLGNTWSHVFGQMQILGFTALNDKVYAATQHGALVCRGNVKDWQSIYEGDALHDIGNDGKYIYAMTIGQQLLKTQNDGALWENAQHGIPLPPNYYTNEIQYTGAHIFSAQWIGLYHSSDHGNNWRLLQGLPAATAFSTLAITDLGILTGISVR